MLHVVHNTNNNMHPKCDKFTNLMPNMQYVSHFCVAGGTTCDTFTNSIIHDESIPGYMFDSLIVICMVLRLRSKWFSNVFVDVASVFPESLIFLADFPASKFKCVPIPLPIPPRALPPRWPFLALGMLWLGGAFQDEYAYYS